MHHIGVFGTQGRVVCNGTREKSVLFPNDPSGGFFLLFSYFAPSSGSMAYLLFSIFFFSFFPTPSLALALNDVAEDTKEAGLCATAATVVSVSLF